jgi:Mg2+ and Co2+ transporter CorA
MNVPVPFAGTPWGFWAVLGLAAVMAITAAVFMIRKNMFR